MKEQEAIVLVLDVGPAMTEASSGYASMFKQSLNCISWILQRKIFAESKDEVALVLFGTANTDNSLAEDDQYQNITEASKLKLADWELLQFVQDLTPGPVSGDFIDALVVALNILQEDTRGKKFTSKKVVLFSNFCGDVADDQVDVIKAGMRSAQINLSVVGPDLDDDGQNSNGKPKTRQQLAGESLVKSIVDAVDGDAYSFEEAVPHLTFFQKKAVRPTPWRVALEIGPSLQIPVGSYVKIAECKPKGWKTTYARDDTPIHTDVSYHINNEEQTEVEKENTVQAYRYGSTLVPFSEDDKTAMAYAGSSKCLSVLGFTKHGNIKRHHYVGDGARLVAADKDDEWAATALSAFIHALYETDMVAIVRYVYSARSSPRIAFLAPHITADSEYLAFVYLPFMEDLRRFTFAPLTAKQKNKPSDEQLTAVDDLIDSMDLTEPSPDDDQERIEQLEPTTVLNPAIQRLYQCLAHRALNPDEPLPDVERHLREYLEPSPQVLAVAKPALCKLKRLFPVEVVQKKNVKSGADVFQTDDVTDGNTTGTDTKRPRLDTPLQGMAQLSHGPVTEIGTVTPVENFKKLLVRQGALPETICKKMQEVIIQIVTESFGIQFYSKAIDCLKALRTESIKLTPKQFNAFLKEFKPGLQDKGRKAFWDLIVKDSLSLITSVENAISEVTESEATKFLEEAATVEAVEDEVEEEDADDLVKF